MQILLHICCGPCLIYPFKRLKEQGFEINGFYYNPNIHPVEEFTKRKETLLELSKDLRLEVEVPEFCEADYFCAINGKQDSAQRCVICWSLRLRNTALEAKKRNIQSFGTTLLVSPYQNHLVIKQLGEVIAQETGVKFYYEDFRPGFKAAYSEARNKGLYLQKYCGCKYSVKK